MKGCTDNAKRTYIYRQHSENQIKKIKLHFLYIVNNMLNLEHLTIFYARVIIIVD